MKVNFYFLLLLLSVFISSFSQVLLKKSALKNHASLLAEYLNARVAAAYAIFGLAICLDLFALKFVSVSLAPAAETLNYVFAILFGKFFFQEKISRRQIFAMTLIVAGVLVFCL